MYLDINKHLYMYNYLFYRFYTAHKKNMDPISGFIWAVICLYFIVFLNIITVFFFLEGLFRFFITPGKWLVFIILILMCLYYLPGKRYKSVFLYCQEWEKKHPVLKKTPAWVYYLVGTFLSGIFCVLSSLYAHGKILSSWRF